MPALRPGLGSHNLLVLMPGVLLGRSYSEGLKSEEERNNDVNDR